MKVSADGAIVVYHAEVAVLARGIRNYAGGRRLVGLSAQASDVLADPTRDLSSQVIAP